MFRSIFSSASVYEVDSSNTSTYTTQSDHPPSRKPTRSFFTKKAIPSCSTCPIQSNVQKDYYIHVAEQVFSTKLKDFKSSEDERPEWKLIGQFTNRKNGIQLFLTPNIFQQVIYRAETHLVGEMKAVLETFQTTTNHSFYQLSSILFPSIKDAKIIHELQSNHRSILNISMKWQLERQLGTDKDYCFLEIIGTRRTEQNRNMGVMIWHSTDCEQCPPFQAPYDVVREKRSICFYIVETDIPNQLLISVAYTSNHVNQSASISEWTLHRGSVGSLLSTCLVNLRNHSQNQAMKTMHITTPTEYRSKKNADHCSLCRAGFTMWKRPYNCNLCGEVICRSCSITVMLTFPVTGSKKARVCKLCTIRRLGVFSHSEDS